jgi:glycosyltransferase involved in cell wall biosynthesis
MLKKPLFSIVIPTLNEAKYLPLLLNDLVKQTYADFEIIHIDGSSDDKTVELAKRFQSKLKLKTKVVSKRNVSFQRNAGAKLASGKWVLFMDADNRLPNYFLQGIKYQLEKHPEVDVFTNWIKVEDKITFSKQIENAINLGYEMYSWIGREAALGALIGVKNKICRQIKFQEKSQIFEDSIFVRDCVKAGYNFLIFREPKYIYSLRRLKKEGSLKMARITTSAQLDYILGKSFDQDNHGYVMKGGEYYDQPHQSPLINLQRFIEKASAKQLTRAKRILKGFMEMEIY